MKNMKKKKAARLDFDAYQTAALRTAGDLSKLGDSLGIWALGICGEAGEVADHIKKHLGHGHPLDQGKVASELGDVLWYLATLCEALGLRLEDVARANVEKLQRRYPKGFSKAGSLNRRE